MALSPSYTLGLFFILLVSLIWAASSVVVQWVYSDQFDFHSPFLVTYIGVSLFTCFLPAHWIATHLFSRGPSDNVTASVVYDSIQESPEATSTNPPSLVWTTQDHVWAAAKIAPVWFASNYAYSASLEYTSITSSTVLASTGSLFTFLFALMARDEHFSLFKLLGVLLGMTGSILTGLNDIEGGNRTSDDQDNRLFWGDFLGLISAVGYGGYASMVRILCPRDESLMSMQLFLGFVGLWNMVLLSPIAIYLGVFQATGLTGFVFGCLVLKGLFDNVLSDYLWARAVVLTSATVATVGLGLTIPLAFASDFILRHPNVLDFASILGALAVLAGFVLVNVGQQQENEEYTERSGGDTVVLVASAPDNTQPPLESQQAGQRSPMDMDEYRDEPADV
jgi:solute carrier family 35 protein F5